YTLKAMRAYAPACRHAWGLRDATSSTVRSRFPVSSLDLSAVVPPAPRARRFEAGQGRLIRLANPFAGRAYCAGPDDHCESSCASRALSICLVTYSNATLGVYAYLSASAMPLSTTAPGGALITS